MWDQVANLEQISFWERCFSTGTHPFLGLACHQRTWCSVASSEMHYRPAPRRGNRPQCLTMIDMDPRVRCGGRLSMRGSYAILLHEVLTERVRSSNCFLRTSHKHDTCPLPSEWYINFCVPPMVSRPHCPESTSNSAFNDIYYASVPCSGSYRKSMLYVLHKIAPWQSGCASGKNNILMIPEHSRCLCVAGCSRIFSI